MTAKFRVPDIECDGCANSIKKTLGSTPGISGVDVDIDAKTVTVDYDPNVLDEPDMADALDDIGFPVKA